MKNKKICFLSLLIAWLFVNLLASKPYRENLTIFLISDIIIFCLNIVFFYVVGWFGWKERNLIISFIFPIIMIVIWFLCPAIFALYRWGGEVFFNFLFKSKSVYFWTYLAVCLFVYVLAATLSVRKRNRSQTGA
jgi:hypothetical protein